MTEFRQYHYFIYFKTYRRSCTQVKLTRAGGEGLRLDRGPGC
jgi:hypothetical protein